jgi:ankyrin repeat protein
LDTDPLGMQRRAKDVDNYEITPFHLACKNNNTDLVEYFMKRSDLLINIRDNRGKTPLHYACEGSVEIIVEMILHHQDVDVNAIDMLNETPLHKVMKFYSNHPDSDPNVIVSMVQKLLDHSFILIDHKNNDNQTPLDIIKACLDVLEEDNNSSIISKECCRKMINLLEEFPIKQRYKAFCYHLINLKDL